MFFPFLDEIIPIIFHFLFGIQKKDQLNEIVCIREAVSLIVFTYARHVLWFFPVYVEPFLLAFFLVNRTQSFTHVTHSGR